MIVFLTLIYVVVLFLLVKIKVISLTLWWKLSPLVWMILLFVVLFLPMQWGAPGGVVNIYQSVVEIVPNVTGQVTEVPVNALTSLKKGDVLFKIESRPFQSNVDNLEASLNLASVNLARAKDLYAKKLGSEVDVDKFTGEVEQLTAQLDSANYDLESTVVRAPGNGYVVGMSLRPGQRAAAFPTRAYMSFVNLEQSRVALGINQNAARHVKQGQPAEITFKFLPGQVFQAKVDDIVFITPQGQLAPSGNIPLAPTAQNVPQPLAVILKLDEDVLENIDLSPLQIGGAFGTGAIYTQSVQATHIIRKVMIRMDAWMNYIMPY